MRERAFTEILDKTLDLSDLAEGTYLARLFLNNKAVAIKRTLLKR